MEIKQLVDDYRYTIDRCEEDDIFIGTCLELQLKAHGKTQAKALKEILAVTLSVLKELQENGEEIPEPLSLRKYSGRVNVRMSPEQHRTLAIQAAESNLSVPQYIKSCL